MADSTFINGGDRMLEIEDSEGNNSKIPALLQKITVLEQEKSELHLENVVIKERIEKVKEEVEASENVKISLKSEATALESVAARAAELELEVSRLQDDLTLSMREVAGANAELVEIKRQIVELWKSELSKSLKLEATEKERNILLEKIKKDGEWVKESNSCIRDLEKKIEALEMRDSNCRNEKVRVEQEMRMKIDDRDGQIQNLENMVEELQAVIERSNKEREELEIVKNELETILKKSERKAKEMENKMGLLHKELEGSEKMISGLKERAMEGINGNDVAMARGIVDDGDKGLMGLTLDWPVVSALSGSIACIAVVYLRYLRQR